jgi:hypothetical protein
MRGFNDAYARNERALHVHFSLSGGRRREARRFCAIAHRRFSDDALSGSGMLEEHAGIDGRSDVDERPKVLVNVFDLAADPEEVSAGTPEIPSHVRLQSVESCEQLWSEASQSAAFLHLSSKSLSESADEERVCDASCPRLDFQSITVIRFTVWLAVNFAAISCELFDRVSCDVEMFLGPL